MDNRLQTPVHGGNLGAVARRFALDPGTLIDFSANINPLGPPPAVLAAIADLATKPTPLTHYPEPHADALLASIGMHVGLERSSLVVGNGASALLDVALRGCAARSCVVPIPAFSEYRRALDAVGVDLHPVPLRADFTLDLVALEAVLERERPGALVLNNPHNPSGALASRSDVLAVLERCRTYGCTCIVDEAFIDYAPEASVIDLTDEDRQLIVVRSLTKFYGMPGIRIGYLATHPRLAARLRAMLPTWPVGAMEIAAAAAALQSDGYARTSLAMNRHERAGLSAALAACGITVYPSAANFLLLELPCSQRQMDVLYECIVRAHGIVVRDARSFDGLAERTLIRVAVRSAEENALLVRALSTVLHALVAGKDA